MKDFFSKFGFLLCIGAAGLLLIAYLAPFVPPDLFWPISFFGLAYPYILLVNIIILIYYVIARSKKLLLPFVVILLGYNHLLSIVQFFPVREETPNGIRVLSYNVHYYNYDSKAKKENPLVIVDYLKSTNADIICLQEANIYPRGKLSPQAIRDALPNINHYQIAHFTTNSGQLTFSKYPIINLGEIRFEGSSNMVLFSDIKISEKKIIRVYNCHFQSYSIEPRRYPNIYPRITGISEKQIDEARELGYTLKSAFIIRAEQARKVAEHIKQSPYPVMVCGDFNDTPFSYTYRKVKQNLEDSFVDAGFGISNTYNGILPMLRIDYIFYDDKTFKPVNYRRERVKYSDHFPVTCTFLDATPD